MGPVSHWDNAGYWGKRSSLSCPQGSSLMPGEHVAAALVGTCLPPCLLLVTTCLYCCKVIHLRTAPHYRTR